jgi:hypothetical protein
MREFVQIWQEIQKLKLPEDWINPIKQIFDQKNFVLQDLDKKS